MNQLSDEQRKVKEALESKLNHYLGLIWEKKEMVNLGITEINEVIEEYNKLVKGKVKELVEEVIGDFERYEENKELEEVEEEEDSRFKEWKEIWIELKHEISEMQKVKAVSIAVPDLTSDLEQAATDINEI